MAFEANKAAWGDLRRLYTHGTVAGLDEAGLLERFATRRDETAFSALVQKHGPMVLGVCRRGLSDPNDVEDAFQATFLVLVRRAPAIRDPKRLAPWLYGVARRVAARARQRASRRQAVERLAAESASAVSTTSEPSVAAERLEMRRALDEEIGRLPVGLRSVVILCDLAGRTQAEAADELGLTPDAVRGRLERARRKLRRRLERRGVAPEATQTGAAGAALLLKPGRLAVPASLLERTVALVTQSASLGLGVGSVPASVVFLSQGVLRAMFLTKLTTGLIGAGGLLSGAIVFGPNLDGRAILTAARDDAPPAATLPRPPQTPESEPRESPEAPPSVPEPDAPPAPPAPESGPSTRHDLPPMPPPQPEPPSPEADVLPEPVDPALRPPQDPFPPEPAQAPGAPERPESIPNPPFETAESPFVPLPPSHADLFAPPLAPARPKPPAEGGPPPSPSQRDQVEITRRKIEELAEKAQGYRAQIRALQQQLQAVETELGRAYVDLSLLEAGNQRPEERNAPPSLPSHDRSSGTPGFSPTEVVVVPDAAPTPLSDPPLKPERVKPRPGPDLQGSGPEDRIRQLEREIKRLRRELDDMKPPT